jgi:hypothetical protein
MQMGAAGSPRETPNDVNRLHAESAQHKPLCSPSAFHAMRALILEFSSMSEIKQNQTTGETVVWGAASIGKVIGRTEKATFAMLEQGKIAGARKVAGRWAFKPAVFFASFDEAAA